MKRNAGSAIENQSAIPRCPKHLFVACWGGIPPRGYCGTCHAIAQVGISLRKLPTLPDLFEGG